MKLASSVIALMLSGCSLMPDAIPLEAQHLSHISQHFDGSGQNLGAQTISTGVRWRRHGVVIDVLDGWTSGIDGRHEVFSARISTEISLHPTYVDKWSRDDP